MYYFPEGSKVYYSTTFASAKTISAITNASPAVATATSHGYSDLDPVLVASGWEDANDTVFEVDSLSADTFGVTGLDSSDTDWFAAGTGTGTAMKISSWVEVPQLLTLTSSGGGPKYGTVDPIGRRNSIKKIIGFEPSSLDLSIGYDAANATIQALNAISRAFTNVAVKIVIPGGGRVYGYGNIAISEVPQMSKGNAITISGAISIDGRMIGYGA